MDLINVGLKFSGTNRFHFVYIENKGNITEIDIHVSSSFKY